MDLTQVRPTRAIIDLDNLDHNFMQIKKCVGTHTKICAVVKANAYGHGAVEVAKTLISCGADYLAVAILDEAIELRNNGIDAPVLILGFTPCEQFDKIVSYEITQTVYDADAASALSQVALSQGKRAKVHIKIDTGMSRLGFPGQISSIPEIKKVFSFKGIQVEGIFTHFAKAESDQAFTGGQFDSFEEVVGSLEDRGFRIPLRHVSNSAATLDGGGKMHMDMVRAGLILYGLLPTSDEKWEAFDLKPVMSVKTAVSCVKPLEKGRAVSYGGEFVTERPSIIATLPVGYADGWRRRMSPGGEALILGRRVPIIGRVCMDQLMADVTDLGGPVRVGDEAVLMGKMGDEEISAEDIAGLIGTINYEVVCSVSGRVPRVYMRHGNIVKIHNMLAVMV